MTLAIGALGPLSVSWTNGSAVQLLAKQRPGLLLALLVAGDGFARTDAEVASLLWPRAADAPDDEGHSAVDNIGKPLFTLRAALKVGAPAAGPGPADVVLRGGGYLRLAPEHVAIDAFALEAEALALLARPPSLARHERAAKLVELLSREFLPELRHERAAAAIRERLFVLRRRLFDETYAPLRESDPDRAADLIEQTFDATPADAAIAYRYVNVLTLERHVERAWRAYERHVAATEALGVAPAPEVARLLSNFREPVGTFGRSSADASELFGRDAVLATIRTELDATAVSGGHIAIIAGEGRGRTRLLLEALRIARKGGAVVGASRGLSGLASDRVVRDLHRSLLASQHSGETGPRIELRASGDSLEGDVEPPLTELRLTILKLQSAKKRVVLALDDPHLIDRTSLDQIVYTIEEAGVTLITTARADLDRIAAGARRVVANDLPVEDERRAIEARLGTTFVAASEARLRALWPGNLAVLLGAAMRADDGSLAEADDDGYLHLLDDVPDGVFVPDVIAASIEARLTSLPRRATIVAAAFAAGRAARSARDIAMIAGLDEDDVEGYGNRLAAVGLVQSAGEGRRVMPPAVAMIASRIVSRERFLEFERRAAELAG